MNNHLQFIFELRARLAGITAAVHRVREFQRSVEQVRASTRLAGADMGRASLAARGLSYALAGVGAARMGFSAISAGAVRARAELAALQSSVLNLRNLLIAGTAAYGTKLVLDAASFKERTLIAMEVLTGSKREAERILREAVRFAAATPFETRDVIDAYQRLLTAGFKPVEIPLVLKGVGDLAALKGFDTGVIDRVILAFQQIRAKGRLQGEELLQLAEAGVPLGRVYEVLARRVGTTVDEVRRLQEAGRISADLGIVAVLEALRGTVSGGQLGQLMDRTSRSLSGLLSTLRSRSVELLMDVDVSPIRNLLTSLVKLTDTQSRIGARFKAMLERYIGGTFRNVFGTLADATDPAKAEAALNRLLDSVENTIAQIAIAWQRIRPALAETWRGILDGINAARSVAQSVAPILSAVAKVLGATAGGMEASTTSGVRLIGMGIALAGVWRLLNLLTLGMAGNVARWGGLAAWWFGRAALAAIRYAVAHRAAIMAATSSMTPMLARLGTGVLAILRLVTPWGLVATAAIAAVALIVRNWDNIKGFFRNLWGSIAAWAGKAWDDLRAGAIRAGQAVLDWFRSLPNRVVSAVRAMGTQFVDGLKAVVRSMPGGDLLLKGLELAGGAIRQVREWGEAVGNAVGQGARDALGVRSPSREFYRIGLAAVAGLSMGLAQTRPVEDVAARLADAAFPVLRYQVQVPQVQVPQVQVPQVQVPQVQVPQVQVPQVQVPQVQVPQVQVPQVQVPQVQVPQVQARGPSLVLRPSPSAAQPITVHIRIDGAQDPKAVARAVVDVLDDWSAGRIVVRGLELLASERGHDA